MNKNKFMKGQTALEYLMTYGWAILIVVIVVGALYALGLTEPCKWTGTQVREFADFRVENPRYDANANTFDFDLSRLRPDTVTVTDIYLGDQNQGDLTATDATDRSVSSAPQGVQITSVTSPGVASGSCYDAHVILQYDIQTASGTASLNSTGTISSIAN